MSIGNSNGNMSEMAEYSKNCAERDSIHEIRYRFLDRFYETPSEYGQFGNRWFV